MEIECVHTNSDGTDMLSVNEPIFKAVDKQGSEQISDEPLADAQSSSTQSNSTQEVTNGDKSRRDKKFHRCLNELKQFLLSAANNASSDTDHSSTSPPRHAAQISGINAIRRALKLLKHHYHEEAKRKASQETKEVHEKRPVPVAASHFPNATDFARHSTAASSWARCWSLESTAADKDKCDDIVQNHEDAVRFIISCGDGTILKVSENAYNILQLVPSSWPLPGRQFLSLFNPNDHPLLVAVMLSTNLVLKFNEDEATSTSKSENDDTQSKDDKIDPLSKHAFGFYASLRRECLTANWKEEPKYVHCRLLCKLVANQEAKGTTPSILSIMALPINILIGPEFPEPSSLMPFYTKHTPACIFTDVDAECVKAWGFLPQELVGRSLLSFVPKDSLKCLEAAHEQAVKAKGKPVRSKLYPFILRDGKSATMQTEWSLFVNPWSRETEFVVGYHKVVDRSKDARFFYDDSNYSAPLSRLDPRAVKAQSRIRRALAKVKEKSYYKPQLISNQLACSSTTHKENGSTVCSSGENGNHRQNESQTFNSLSSASSFSKSKRALNMGVFLDRMIENELLRHDEIPDGGDINANLENCKMMVVGELGGDLHAVHDSRVPRHETSPISAGEAISSSPPDSSGSGPTYKEINLKEKVARFLNSQTSDPGTSHPASSGECQSQHSNEYSPPAYHHSDNRPIEDDQRDRGIATATKLAVGDQQEPGLGAIDLTTVVAAASSMMHRSQSAGADLNQYRHLTAALEGDAWNVPLTPEILRQFTKEKERESKADWKRRFSTADASSIPPQALQQHPSINCASIEKSINQKECDRVSPSGKRPPLDQSSGLCNQESPPQKMLRLAAEQFYTQRENRPSSMPVVSRAGNVVVEPGNKNSIAPSWPSQAVSRTTTDYYRSLGPTPAPPPGKNFQISSAPLPAPGPGLMDSFATNANADKIAFQYPINQMQPPYGHQSAFAPPTPKVRNQPTVDGHHSVIQASTGSSTASSTNPWLHMPGTSASSILQRMVPKALAREQAEAAPSPSTNFWCPQPQTFPFSESMQTMDLYARGYQPQSQQPENRNLNQYVDYSATQTQPYMGNCQLGTMYSDFSNPLENRLQQKPSDVV